MDSEYIQDCGQGKLFQFHVSRESQSVLGIFVHHEEHETTCAVGVFLGWAVSHTLQFIWLP